MMRRALYMARLGEGYVEPNPMVGCVLVRDGRVIGEGYHRRFGGPHAEIEALRSCVRSPKGATVYVCLEPCCHFGKTPPCTEALIQAKVARVVIPFADPNPLVSGRGIRRLRAEGIHVDRGVMVAEAADLAAPFITRTCLKRPYIILKWAQSRDGQLIVPPGRRQWISCETSRRTVHRLRARVDGILVGSGTVLKDDPLLTVRGTKSRRRAVRIVLDRRLRISEKCRLVATAWDQPTLVFASRTCARSTKARRLRDCGVQVVACDTRSSGASLRGVLRELAERSITNLLVEGGPTILSSFLQEQLADEVRMFVAPKSIRVPRRLLPRWDAFSRFALAIKNVKNSDQCVGSAMSKALEVRTLKTSKSGIDRYFRLTLTDPLAILRSGGRRR